MMSGSASWMMRRTSARVSARQPPRDRIRSSTRREAAFPVARFASAPGLAFAPAFGGDLDLVADLRGLLARDVPLAFGSLLFGFSATVHSPTCCDAQRSGAERPAEAARRTDKVDLSAPVRSSAVLDRARYGSRTIAPISHPGGHPWLSAEW